VARTDAIVLGAGIVGTCVALHLAKRGLAVALVDRTGVGEETSFGNAGIIEGNTVFPPAFSSDLTALLRIALKRGLSKPDQVTAHKYLAFIQCASGREAQCRDEFKRALRIDPDMTLAPAEAGHPIWGPVFKSVKAGD
jgi:glycine/D-amino acid oxidase-like deaminating enzyme